MNDLELLCDGKGSQILLVADVEDNKLCLGIEVNQFEFTGRTYAMIELTDKNIVKLKAFLNQLPI